MSNPINDISDAQKKWVEGEKRTINKQQREQRRLYLILQALAVLVPVCMLVALLLAKG